MKFSIHVHFHIGFLTIYIHTGIWAGIRYKRGFRLVTFHYLVRPFNRFSLSMNANLSTPYQERFRVGALIELIVLLIPGILLNLFVQLMILRESTFPKPVRLLMLNLLAANITVGLSGVILNTADVIISATNLYVKPSEHFCRIFTWMYLSGGACRFSFMAVFTVVVFLFVRYGHNGVVLRYVVLTVCMIWVINISLNAVVWSPQVITITIAKNVTCSPTLSDEGGLPFLIMYVFLYGILSYAVTIVTPILSCLYIRHRSISGDLKSQKALVRFTLFLVIGNTISFIGQIVPVVITEALPEGDGAEEALLEDIVLTAEGWLVFFSLFPTSLLILLYFQPLRQKICFICTCKCSRVITRRKGSTTLSSGV